MEQSVGDNDRFKQRQQEILNDLGKTDDLIHEINNSLDIRAVISLWREVDVFIEKFPVSQTVLTRFHQVRTQLGLLALHGLIKLFIKRFNKCGDIHALAKFIRNEITGRTLYSDDLKRLQKQADAVLSSKGPEKIVAFTMKNDRKLNDVIRMVGIPADQSGRYIDVCRQYYYIESLKRLEPGTDSNIFNELVQDAVVRMPYNDKWLGHEVLSIMIQKGIDSGNDFPENWRNIILNIADDPRDKGQGFREWWSLLPQRHIEAMQGWMAGLDLDLFLKALQNFAVSSGDVALKRMFKGRAQFLRGLYAHKLIKKSKLFIGIAPERYLKAQYDEDQMPKFSRLNDPDLSVIYLKVGNIHMVEGSHNFSLRLYKQLPDETLFSFNPRARGFNRRELGIGLAEKYERQHGGNVFAVTHNPSLLWRYKTIQEMQQQGVTVDPEWVLTPDDYPSYRRQFPL